VLLFSFDRMYWATAFHIVFLVLAFYGVSHALDSKAGDRQDIVTKNKKGDMITSPQKKSGASGGDTISSSAKKGSNTPAASSLKTSATRERTSMPDEPLKPDQDYLDVYVGKCQFTIDAMSASKRFSAQHQNYSLRYYMMKTQSDFGPTAGLLEGIEFYLPLEAKKYAITTVPAFILNRKGVTYRISGDADLNGVYAEIENNTAKGEEKGGYIDLGDRGKGCRSVIFDWSPTVLTTQQRREIEAENRPPDMRGLIKANRVSMPESSKPIHLEKQILSLAGGKEFIVFSENQTDWAIKEIKRSGATGCCIDCLDLSRIWPHAQYCSKELLKEWGVNSIPTVITLKSSEQRPR